MTFSLIKHLIPEVTQLEALLATIYKQASPENTTELLKSSVKSLHLEQIHNGDYIPKEDDSFTLQMLEDFIWERLNSVHWKEVPVHWRKLYAFIILVKVITLSKTSVTAHVLIKDCDTGLLMGDCTLGKTLSSIATCLHASVQEQLCTRDRVQDVFVTNSAFQIVPTVQLVQLPGPRLEIPCLAKPSLETFRQNHFQPCLPAVIKNAIEHWPALSLWSPEYIAGLHGSRTVPVELGSKYTEEDWTQKLMTIEDFVKNHFDRASPSLKLGYLAQHTLFDQIPELRDEIRVPEYCFLGDSDDVEINAWFGPALTVTPVHYDPKHNLLAQVFGTKIIRLFPPSESIHLCPHDPDSLLFNTSQVDMEDETETVLTKFPTLATASYTDVILQPGSILYMPPKWWHFVKSLSPSFSVSFWFE